MLISFKKGNLAGGIKGNVSFISFFLYLFFLGQYRYHPKLHDCTRVLNIKTTSAVSDIDDAISLPL